MRVGLPAFDLSGTAVAGVPCAGAIDACLFAGRPLSNAGRLVALIAGDVPQALPQSAF